MTTPQKNLSNTCTCMHGHTISSALLGKCHNHETAWDWHTDAHKSKASLSLCNIHFSLNKCLRTEDTNCWSVDSGILSHVCLINILSCSTVWGCRCWTLCFVMGRTFWIGDKTGLPPGQFIKCILLLWTHAAITRVECGSAFERCRNVSEKHISWKEEYVVAKPLCTSEH